MHLQVYQKIPFSVLIIALILTCIPNSSVFAGENEQYRNCSTRFDCANIQGLAYPFWEPNRPDYCGHPQFKLNCSGEAPVITIISTAYRVLRIDQEKHVLAVARVDYWNETCPEDPKNTTLDPNFFEYSTDTQDLYLYYRCTSSSVGEALTYKFSCPDDDATHTNYFATDRTRNSFNLLTQYCEKSVVVPISNSEAAVLEGATVTSPANLTSALLSGFGIDWRADNSGCDDCVRSGGACGFNTTASAFTCYCKDRPYAYRCGSDSATGSGGGFISSNGKWIIGISAAALGMIISAILIIRLYKAGCISSTGIAFWKRATKHQEFDVEAFMKELESFALKRYSYAAVKKLTNSFAEKIGKGGYGAVYKGKLPDGLPVAVKVLHESKTSNGEEFINEVASIGRTSHVNIVTLLGFCYEKKKRALVYEYMPNGSLDKFIFNQEHSNAECHLKWKTLYEIAIGIARGLEYLHRGCKTRILHFDIKPQNILLDEDFCPKISDFGLSKLCLTKESIVSMMGARGTIGYIAPEVFSRSYGGASHKSDVYSYGMLILEMVGGRKNYDSAASQTSEIYYPNRIFKDIEMGNEANILGDITEEEKEISRKMILVSFWCIQTNPADRPPMSKVVDMLEGGLESIDFPPKPYLFSPTRSP